jgi:hypothetical protein
VLGKRDKPTAEQSEDADKKESTKRAKTATPSIKQFTKEQKEKKDTDEML